MCLNSHSKLIVLTVDLSCHWFPEASAAPLEELGGGGALESQPETISIQERCVVRAGLEAASAVTSSISFVEVSSVDICPVSQCAKSLPWMHHYVFFYVVKIS